MELQLVGALRQLDQDGILRSYGWHKNGTLRDTVVFSVIAQEWAAVKKNLEFKLAR